MKKKIGGMLNASIIKRELKPIRFTSSTTEPKNRITTTSEDIRALRDYLFHKEKLEKNRLLKIKITFP